MGEGIGQPVKLDRLEASKLVWQEARAQDNPEGGSLCTAGLQYNFWMH